LYSDLVEKFSCEVSYVTLVINKTQLIENGETAITRKARQIALESLDTALTCVEPGKLLKSQVFMENSEFIAGEHRFDLSKIENIYVLGGGKAAGAMAGALEEILGMRIKEGVINVPDGDQHKTHIVKKQEASHPIPDNRGVEGTRSMMSIAGKAHKDDLVIVLISGGGSSLMPLPRNGITLEDKQNITNCLLKSGARIQELNAVRKHISNFKGGWLAKKAFPASILNLILSDVVGDNLDAIASGPTTPDSTTFADARRVLEKYNLWKNAPLSIRKLLLSGAKGCIAETPKPDDSSFQKVKSLILGNCRSAAIAATRHLRAAGLNALLLTTTLEGEAKCAGDMLGTLANSIGRMNEPIPKPAAIVAAGETTVAVIGNGRGGRNQELVLGAALRLDGAEGVVVASLSSDGIDGPTNAAGAIADAKTVARATRKGIDPKKMLSQNDSNTFFTKLGDTIITGSTGTNVNDISVIIVV
jgi:glycerate-2-kinase